MAYHVEVDQGTLAGPTDIQPSFGLSLLASAQSAAAGNITQLGADYLEVQKAGGAKITKDAADQQFKAAGVKQSAPADGYTQGAIDILIKRRQKESELQRIDAATPWSWLGSPVRGTASILAGLTDPLNIASAFVPVVGEARAASFLARAGDSALGIAGRRAAIGAAEGAVGAALVEAPTYAIRTELQDDYHLSDSLLNMTFGTALGGGLHAVGGALGDSLSGRASPYARFSGLSTKEVRQVLDFESGKVLDVTGFTTAQRRAAGISDEARQEPTVRQLIEPPVQDGYVRVYHGGQEMEGVTARDVAPGDRRYAEGYAAKSGEDGRVFYLDIPGNDPRLIKAFDDAGTSAQAPYVHFRLEGEEARQMQPLQMAADPSKPISANANAAIVSPQTREAMARTALADMAEGRMPAVEAVMRTDPAVIGEKTTALDVKQSAELQRRPDSAYLVDRGASEAATERLKTAKPSGVAAAAEEELAQAEQRLNDLRKNLEANGIQKERIAKLSDLSAFDEEVKRAGSIGEVAKLGAICGNTR